MQGEGITVWWESQTSRGAKQAMGCDLPEYFSLQPHLEEHEGRDMRDNQHLITFF